MPFVDLKDVRIHYELAGAEHAPALMFSNSLGTDLTMWNLQMPEVTKKFRVLRYDKRGHGQSSALPGPYTIEMLGRDAIALLDHLKFDKVHFCGLSIGGQTGMWLGLNAAARLNKLILSSTAAKIGAPELWKARIDTVRQGGTKAVSAAVIERWFTPGFRASRSSEVERIKAVLEKTNTEGYIGCCAAVRDFDARGEVNAIRTPTLVISGTHDPAATPADGRWLSQQIAGARFVELDASHISNIEAAEGFTAAITEFLAA